MSEAEQKRSLVTIVGDIDFMDQMAEAFDPERHQELLGELGEKVDSYKKLIEFCEAEASIAEVDLQRFQKRKRGYLAMAKATEERLVFVMQEKSYERLPGKECAAVLRRNTQPKLILKAEATKETFLAFRDYMKLDYSFDNKTLKKAVEDGDEAALQLASLEYGFHVQFEPVQRAAGSKKEPKK